MPGAFASLAASAENSEELESARCGAMNKLLITRNMLGTGSQTTSDGLGLEVCVCFSGRLVKVRYELQPSDLLAATCMLQGFFKQNLPP